MYANAVLVRLSTKTGRRPSKCFLQRPRKQGFVTGQIRVKDTWVDGSRDARPTKEVEELDIEVDEVDVEDSSEIIR
jgi:hypothetical protein